jgi:hypothetical protein
VVDRGAPRWHSCWVSAQVPVTVAVRRADGSVEHVQVGTAVRAGDGFRVTFAELTIGGAPAGSDASSRRSAPPPASSGGAVFPPYGRSKGAPVAGASMQDLEYYASGCRRSLADQSKSRWHDKERQLLAAIEAEIARQGGSPGGGEARGGGPRGGRSSAPMFDEPPPFGDDDIPSSSDDLPF